MSIAGELYYHVKNYINSHQESKSINKIISNFINDKSISIKNIANLKSYYKNGGRSPFPYSIEKEFNVNDVIILYDDLPYILHNNRKLFFPRNFNATKIQKLYIGLNVEQHKDCPHCYTQNGFSIQKGTTLLDIGCADGMFSLDNIENVEQLILFETRESWIEALKKTFEPWKEKVEIVNAFVSDNNSKKNVTIDSCSFKKSDHFFLKIDVEGAEEKVLSGASRFLTNQESIQIAIATYHYANDYINIESILSQYNFETTPTDGYILFYYDTTITSPFLRRCILQGRKNNQT